MAHRAREGTPTHSLPRFREFYNAVKEAQKTPGDWSVLQRFYHERVFSPATVKTLEKLGFDFEKWSFPEEVITSFASGNREEKRRLVDQLYSAVGEIVTHCRNKELIKAQAMKDFQGVLSASTRGKTIDADRFFELMYREFRHDANKPIEGMMIALDRMENRLQ